MQHLQAAYSSFSSISLSNNFSKSSFRNWPLFDKLKRDVINKWRTQTPGGSADAEKFYGMGG
jgi:hypothetical protein